VIVQLGAFAEHQGLAVEFDGKRIALDGPHFLARLSAGAGAQVKVSMKRYANSPTAALPWDR
jgi:hypothetical protein